MSDISSAVKQLLRNRTFSAVAVLALALGIGVNSVMFSLVDAVLFRPLPVAQPEQIARIGMTDAKASGFGGVSYPQMKDLARQTTTFESLAGMSGGSQVNLGTGSDPVERVTATAVSGNFFALLGARHERGRLLTPQDDITPGAHPVLVLSESFWRRRFASDPSVVGTTVRVNTKPYTVIGVTARGFHGVELESVPDLWVPLTMAAEMSPNIGQFKPFERRGFTWVSLIGRMKSGVTMAAGRAELDTINRRINEEFKIDVKGDRYDRFSLMSLNDSVFGLDRPGVAARSSWILIGVTGLVLLVACAVAASLLLVRGEQRQRELAVRLAVGASRSRLVRQLLAESLVLSLCAAGVGLMLANWTTGAFLGLAPADFPLPTAAATPILDLRVLAFTIGLALLCTLTCGLLPAFRMSRPNLVDAMKVDGGGFTGTPRALSLRNGFVVVQMALSTILLVGAGLLLRTLGEASRVDLGFDTRDALVISLDVSKSGYTKDKGQQFYRQLLDEVRALPGVRSAALSRHVPVQNAGMITTVTLSNVPPVEGREPEVAFTPVSTDFFKTLGLRIERGRDFSRADEGGPSILMVNRAFADRFWPGRDALRERVLNFGEKGAEVIGVVANAKLTSVRESNEPMIYVPQSDFYVPNTSLLVRVASDSSDVLSRITSTVRRLDVNVPLFRVRTLAEHVGTALTEERAIAAMLAAFGSLALLLAALGLYGVIAYTTQIRSREFGIRLALGALPRALLVHVLRQGAILASVGVAIGLAVAAGASRVLGSLLFGVSPTDGATFAVIGLGLIAVALCASAIPARRAARVDPIRTLRAE